MKRVIRATEDLLDRQKMRELRDARKLTQGAAAELAGMTSKSQWSDVETGRSGGITLKLLGKIASALDVNPADLLVKPHARGKKK